MRANLSLLYTSLLVTVMGCNDLFGITPPEPLPEAAGGGGGGGRGGGGGANPVGGAGGQMTGSTSTSTGTGSTGMPGPCGNGTIDMGEACDPADPATGAKCTSLCTVLDVLQIAAGAAHTCALLAGGLVKCWGFNGNGELGLDAPIDVVGDQPGEMGKDLQPVNLGVGQAAQLLAVGASHTCALLQGGAVKCWGLNSAGQLGLGDTLSRGDQPGQMGDALPAVDLGPNAIVTDIAAGSQHTCARLANGNVKCWGKNEHGQIGQGDLNPVTLGDEPAEMGAALPLAAGGVQRIAAGDFHTCALFDDDSVRCWGYNNMGQLGVGDTQDHGNSEKVATVALEGAASLVWARGNQSCALLETGIVKCWGDNTVGQLGLLELGAYGDDFVEAGAIPEVSLDSPPEGLFAWGMGKQHTCGVFPMYGVKCWGRNNYGQLGIGTNVPNTTQPPVKSDVANIGLGVVTVVGGGAFHSCAWAPEQGLRCWGRNQAGQLGLESTTEYGMDPTELGSALPAVRLVSETW